MPAHFFSFDHRPIIIEKPTAVDKSQFAVETPMFPPIFVRSPTALLVLYKSRADQGAGAAELKAAVVAVLLLPGGSI